MGLIEREVERARLDAARDENRVYPITFVTETSHRELAEAVANAIHDHDDILQFVLVLDEVVADYDFTQSLRDALSAALAVEDAAEVEARTEQPKDTPR